jgi:hypothetical protein
MLSSTHAAGPPGRVPPGLSRHPPETPLDAIGPIEEDDHILVLGGLGAELMCALLRAGATNVIHLRAHERPEADSASLVIVPRVPSLDWLATALPSIRRALTAHGRLVLYAGGQLTVQTQIRRTLTLNGLSVIHTRATSDGPVISAQRPDRPSA